MTPRTNACLAMMTALLGGACTDDGASSEPPSEEWSLLLEADWTLPANDEGYRCARVTAKEDTWVKALRPIAPLGTHHTVFTISGASTVSAPDDVFDCEAATIGQAMLFGSGVGTGAFEFPEGVAIRLEAGTQLLLNLHLFNVSEAPLSGTSGIEVKRVDPADVVEEAEIVLAGKVRGLTVDPGRTVQTGECEMTHDATLFAVFPHMHQLGAHLRATTVPASGASQVLVDAPYSFESQRYYPVDPRVELAEGDRVSIECEYENPGTETVTFGDSSLSEMCFLGLYRYPKGDSRGFICTEFGAAGGPTLVGPPCAKEGAPGNEIGAGKQCTKAGGECAPSAPICLADYTGGEFGNFCTLTCADDADCGSGATCRGGSAAVKACIPVECDTPTPTDAGT